MTTGFFDRENSGIDHSGWIRRGVLCTLVALILPLCSCGSHFRVIQPSADRDSWGGEESEIWISGERKKIFLLVVKADSIVGKLTGSNGEIKAFYVLDPPPWTNKADHLTESAEAWQYPAWAYHGPGLFQVSLAMGVPSKHCSYLISVNPLVIAITDERVPVRRSQLRVYLVDRIRNPTATKIFVLDGGYPANADLMSGSESDESDAIRSRSRIVETSGMTLTEILDSPRLWTDEVEQTSD